MSRTAAGHLEEAEYWLAAAEKEMHSATYNTRVVLALTAVAQTHAQLAGLAEALTADDFWPSAAENAEASS